MTRRKSLILLLPCWLPLMMACGRTDRIYSDPAPAVTTSSTPPISIDGRSVLPQGFYDQSVNRAVVNVSLDGSSETSAAIRLQTQAGSNELGGFNGPAKGNRALLGLGEISGRKLSDIGEITFDSKVFTGSESISALMIVDRECDNTSLQVLIADGPSLAPGSARDQGYTRYSAGFSEAKWKATGPSITDPSSPSVVLVPSASSGSAATSLDAYMARHPSACVRNGASGDDGLPRNIPTAGILFALGNPETETQNGAYIRRITVGAEVYEDLERGRQ